PLFSIASLLFIFISFTFSLTTPPPPISRLTAASISGAATISGSLSPLKSVDSLTSKNAFTCCSAYCGKAATGTPYHKLSSTEFHPQCEMKPPTARWPSTATCGAHPITFPIFSVRSKNPSGRTSRKSVYSVGTGGVLISGPGFLNDHKNRAPLASKPAAISAACSRRKPPIVPKQRKTTDFSGCLSSHSTTSRPSGEPAGFSIGPTG
ncbi:cysteine/Histidine-rich C1 domain family protein, partial [Striga asiatica]